MSTSKNGLPNTWSAQQAATWLGINHRLLLDLLRRRLLPGIAKWIIPREAFIKAWQNFTVSRGRS